MELILLKSISVEPKEIHKKKNIEFIYGDATQYDYNHLKPITVLTLSNVLEHIDDRVAFLKEVVKNLKWKNPHHAKILIRVPAIDRDWISVYKKEQGVNYRLDKTHFTEYTESQLVDELKDSGVAIKSFSQKLGEIYAECVLKLKNNT